MPADDPGPTTMRVAPGANRRAHGRGQGRRRPDHEPRGGGPDQSAELADAGRGVGHHRDAAGLPDGAGRHQQIATRWDQYRDTVAGEESGILEGPGADRRAPVEVGPGECAVGAVVDR